MRSKFLAPTLLIAATAMLAPAQTLTLPPALTSAGATTTVEGQAWGYVVWTATSPEWAAGHQVAVYLKAEPAGSFERQGVMAPLTDPNAIKPWITRAAKLGDDVGECAEIAAALHDQWMTDDEPLPAALHERLSMLGVRASEDPGAAAALRQIGNAHPLFRFLSGTGWGGPLGVANGQSVTIELRERTGGVEGAVVGRVTLTAGTTDTLTAVSAPVQVKPDFPTTLPPGAIAPPNSQLDRAIHLRWAIPDPLRRQLLLTRGFHVWRLTEGFTPPGGLNGNALFAAEDNVDVKRLTRHPAVASKLFDAGDVADFDADRGTWFIVDDNDRYDFDKINDDPLVVNITGTPYTEGDRFDYVVAPVDLLGRIGPVSPRGTGTAAYTVPPTVPDVRRVENTMNAAGDQRLRVVWKPNANALNEVPTTHYMIFRDRDANAPVVATALDRSSKPAMQHELVYLATIPHDGELDEMEFVDDALTPDATNFNNTYFYCIRAAHLGPCGYNVSAPSPAEFGVLRDREGPPAPTGYVAADCPRVGVAFDQDTLGAPIDFASVDQNSAEVRFVARRGLADGRWQDVAWVQFSFGFDIGDGNPIWIDTETPRLYFGNTDRVWTDAVLPDVINKPWRFRVIAGNAAGRISHSATFDNPLLADGRRYQMTARAVGAPTIEIQPPGSGPDDKYWTSYFPNSVIGLSPMSFVPGSTAADITAAVGSILIQRRSVNFVWENFDTALLTSSPGQIVYQFPGSTLSSPTRAWEIIDPGGAPDPADCPHTARVPGSTTVNPIKVVLALPVGSKEYRLYRRIDDGPLALLKQDVEKWDDDAVRKLVHSDDMLPVAGGIVRYYGQVFDEHGNPGPLALLGEAVASLPKLPIPVLDPVQFGGTDTAPTVTLRTACPRPGVRRIAFIFGENKPAPPAGMSVESQPVGSLLFNFGAGVPLTEAQAFDSSLVSDVVLGVDPDSPFLYTKSFPIESGVEYSVQVAAVDGEGKRGPLSAPRVFTWVRPVAGGTVAWPPKPVPETVNWHNDIAAFQMENAHFVFPPFPPPTNVVTTHPPERVPVGVRIGRVPMASSIPGSNWAVRGVERDYGDFTITFGFFGIKDATGFSPISQPPDLMKQFLLPQVIRYGDIFVTQPGETLPLVLYRRQTHRLIAGSSEALTDTDLVQVSPMIETISWQPHPTIGPDIALFVDPFVGIALLEPNRLPLAADLMLFDTSPVAFGATYQYYLVHFDDAGEPEQIIDAGTVTIE